MSFCSCCHCCWLDAVTGLLFLFHPLQCSKFSSHSCPHETHVLCRTCTNIGSACSGYERPTTTGHHPPGEKNVFRSSFWVYWSMLVMFGKRILEGDIATMVMSQSSVGGGGWHTRCGLYWISHIQVGWIASSGIYWSTDWQALSILLLWTRYAPTIVTFECTLQTLGVDFIDKNKYLIN